MSSMVPHVGVDWCHICGIRSSDCVDVTYPDKGENEICDRSRSFRICGLCVKKLQMVVDGKCSLGAPTSRPTIKSSEFDHVSGPMGSVECSGVPVVNPDVGGFVVGGNGFGVAPIKPVVKRGDSHSNSRRDAMDCTLSLCKAIYDVGGNYASMNFDEMSVTEFITTVAAQNGIRFVFVKSAERAGGK